MNADILLALIQETYSMKNEAWKHPYKVPLMPGRNNSHQNMDKKRIPLFIVINSCIQNSIE